MLNNLSNIFFKYISDELLSIEKNKIKTLYNNFNLNNIEQKKFKIYNPLDDFHDYKIITEENDKFYSGLFKLPIKTLLS